MAPPKLSQAEKQDILQLYNQMSNAELAERFGVSISTIARVIKEGKDLSLIQPKKAAKQLEQLDLIPVELPEMELEAKPIEKIEKNIQEATKPIETNIQEETKLIEEDIDEEIEPIEELEALKEVVGDDFEDDIDLTEEEEEPEEEDTLEEILISALLTIRPFHELGLPELCYVVIDRAAEIVTRPLKDFRELGKLPSEQEQCRTLPLFHTHRLARRFSSPHQLVIKMPGHLVMATQEQLRQKGITYIFFNHGVYSL